MSGSDVRTPKMRLTMSPGCGKAGSATNPRRRGDDRMFEGRAIVRAWMFVFALTVALLTGAHAQQAQPAGPPPESFVADLTPLKQLLDQIQQAIGRAGHTDQSLTDLREKLAPIRDGLRDKFDVLDPRLAEVDSRLSQLGPAPAPGAPAESPTIAAERAQLAQ